MGLQSQTLLSSFYFHLSMPLSFLRSSAAGEKQKLLSKCENYGWSSLLRFLYQQWQARFMFTHLWWTSFPCGEPREGCSNDNLPSAYHVSGTVLRDLHMGPHLIAYNNFKKQFFFFFKLSFPFCRWGKEDTGRLSSWGQPELQPRYSISIVYYVIHHYTMLLLLSRFSRVWLCATP